MAGLRGVVGRIDWGYFAAAALNGFALSGDLRTGTTLTGTVVMADAFKIRQRPLIFVVPLKVGGDWRFPILGDVTIAGGRLTAQLGGLLPGGPPIAPTT